MKKIFDKCVFEYCKFADENEAYIGAAIVLYTMLFLTLMVVL